MKEMLGQVIIKCDDRTVFNPMSSLVFHLQINDKLFPYERRLEGLAQVALKGDKVKLIVENQNKIEPGKHKIAIGNIASSMEAKFTKEVVPSKDYVEI